MYFTHYAQNCLGEADHDRPRERAELSSPGNDYFKQ